jgi:hypothetical protein|tara:strand:- start:3264 stop:3431 length:168 start_codon:yes stop_codon:yes gene_type:complete
MICRIRKKRHIMFLRMRIAELHDTIFKRALRGNNPVKIEAKLLLKYNRRLRLILY